MWIETHCGDLCNLDRVIDIQAECSNSTFPDEWQVRAYFSSDGGDHSDLCCGTEIECRKYIDKLRRALWETGNLITVEGGWTATDPGPSVLERKAEKGGAA